MIGFKPTPPLLLQRTPFRHRVSMLLTFYRKINKKLSNHKIMAKSSGGTRGTNANNKQSVSSLERGREMFGYFLAQGGHSSAEVNKSIDSSFAPSFIDAPFSSSDLAAFDKVFEKIGTERNLYKGTDESWLDYAMKQTGAKSIEDLAGKSFTDKFYSSLIINKSVQQDYSLRTIDFGRTPVRLNFHLGKSAKIAYPERNGHNVTDNEITLGRNQKYHISKVKFIEGDDYDYYVVDIKI